MFVQPQRVFFKRGCLMLALEDVMPRHRAFVVSDSSIDSTGLIEKLAVELGKRDIEYHVWIVPTGEPTLDQVKKATGLAKDYESDMVIGFGGGSAMNGAKAVYSLLLNPELDLSTLEAKSAPICPTSEKVSSKIPLVCIPTAAGSGSEVVPFAVVRKDDESFPTYLHHDSLMPSMAVEDPAFCTSLPPALRALTSIDILCHGIDSCISSNATEFSLPFSNMAVKNVFMYARKHVEALDPVAEEKISNAAGLAGIAVANALLSTTHAIALALAPIFGVHHGAISAIVLPYVVKMKTIENPAVQKKIDEMAVFCGFKCRGCKSTPNCKCGPARDCGCIVDSLIYEIRTLVKDLGLKDSLSSLIDGKITLDELKKIVFEKSAGWSEEKGLEGIMEVLEKAW
ncbi:Iron-type alcohol dehydrogenase-like protein [Aduncisulcus paluster]|uniref:Iron-type alcohol dehydrogenase-like protein n=1 Tax=Aduncisulcus paluster TaxID=2918883 RepID=A0ABQ5KYK2_9EUKA|nr:Iron-type alcohol dehydrogenase-like protein [Aduncisulcus paluster]